MLHPALQCGAWNAWASIQESAASAVVCGSISWLSLGPDLSPRPVRVGASLLQGDALSPVALNAVEGHLRGNERSIIFLDDRSFTTVTFDRASFLGDRWAEAVEIMGFQENRDKEQVLCHGPKRREQALDAGFEERHLHRSSRILGFDFSRTPASPCGDARLKEGRIRAQSVQAAPAGFHSKANALATCVVPLATWGWWLTPLKAGKGGPVQRAICNTMVSRTLPGCC